MQMMCNESATVLGRTEIKQIEIEHHWYSLQPSCITPCDPLVCNVKLYPELCLHHPSLYN